MFAMLEVCVALVPLLISPLATLLYNSSLDTCPQSWALASLAINVLTFVLLLTVHKLQPPIDRE